VGVNDVNEGLVLVRDLAEHGNEPINRDDQHTVLVALCSGCTNHAQDGECATRAPSPSVTTETRCLCADSTKVTPVVCPGLRLDREPEVGRRNRHRIDVPSPCQRSP
jgi:hypothetical protein